MKYRCLTVKPEYATAFVTGDKTNEYRSWKTSYRGDLLICAGAKRTPGCVCGHAVMLADLYRITGKKGDYTWHLRNHRLINPVPIKGKLRIFDVDIDNLTVFDDNTPQDVIDSAFDLIFV